jgi:hypothetical protein
VLWAFLIGFTGQSGILKVGFESEDTKGGKYTPNNMILLDENKHRAFHLLFGLKTFREAAALLIRTAEMKERQVA